MEKRTLSEYKEYIKEIENEILNLEQKKIDVYKESKNLFMENTKEFFNEEYKFIKLNRVNNTIYGVIKHIEPTLWNNGKKIIQSNLNLYGLFVAENKNSFVITDLICLDTSYMFNFFDVVEETSKEEINIVIDKWYNNTDKDYSEPFIDEDGTVFGPIENWFFTDNYHHYFQYYKDILNNKLINKEFNKNKM